MIDFSLVQKAALFSGRGAIRGWRRGGPAPSIGAIEGGERSWSRQRAWPAWGWQTAPYCNGLGDAVTYRRDSPEHYDVLHSLRHVAGRGHSSQHYDVVQGGDARATTCYWAIQRSWFARVYAFCNLSCKKSREVAAHFRADFWVGVASRFV